MLRFFCSGPKCDCICCNNSTLPEVPLDDWRRIEREADDIAVDFDGEPLLKGFEDEDAVDGAFQTRSVMKLDGDVPIGKRRTATNQQNHSLVRLTRRQEILCKGSEGGGGGL